MANSSAKKLHKANTRRLNFLGAAIITPTIAYALRWFLFSSPASFFHKIVFVILSLLQSVLFSLIWLSAKPTYSKDGALVEAGHDISAPGMLEYTHDIIYLTVFIQLLLLFTRWALLFYIIVPIVAIYFSWCASASTPFSEPDDTDQPSELSTMSRKERRKAERAARKQRS